MNYLFNLLKFRFQKKNWLINTSIFLALIFYFYKPVFGQQQQILQLNNVFHSYKPQQKCQINGNGLVFLRDSLSNLINLKKPQSIAVDAIGNLYITDTQNDSIKKFDANGILQNSWGMQGVNTGEFKNPKGVAIDPTDENMYVADTGNNRVQKLNFASGVWTEWCKKKKNKCVSDKDGFMGPSVVVTNGQNVYVSDAKNRVQILNGTTGSRIETIESNTHVNGLAVGSSGILNNTVLYLATGNQIRKYINANNSWTALSVNWPKTNDNNDGLAMSVTLDTDGNVYALNQGVKKIVKYSPDGLLLSTYRNPSKSTCASKSAQGIYYSSNSSSVYLVDTENNRIQEIK